MGCAVCFISIVKKVVFCISAFLLSAILSDAALLLSDSFSYPDGPLVTVTAARGQLQRDQRAGEGRCRSDLFKQGEFRRRQATLAGQPYALRRYERVLYVSFKINYTNLPSSSGGYFAEFKDGGTGFRARIFAQTAGAASGAFPASASPTPAVRPPRFSMPICSPTPIIPSWRGWP